MRSIEVSTAVYSAIWARRLAGEETEDEILTRVLGVAMGLSERAGRQTGKARGKKMRWVDDVVEALQSLGGAAYYSDIYDAVRTIRSAAGRSLPPSFDEIVRKEIETHSSDSEAFAHREDFFSAPRGKGAGFWALRAQ